jgi:hypothetical protein
MVVVIAGAVYDDHKFQCTDTPSAIWVDLGAVTVGYSTGFIVADWVLDAPNNEYDLNITHNLNTSYPEIIIRDSSNNVVQVERVHTINSNVVQLVVPANPDMRFIGSIAVLTT